MIKHKITFYLFIYLEEALICLILIRVRVDPEPILETLDVSVNGMSVLVVYKKSYINCCV